MPAPVAMPMSMPMPMLVRRCMPMSAPTTLRTRGHADGMHNRMRMPMFKRRFGEAQDSGICT